MAQKCGHPLAGLITFPHRYVGTHVAAPSSAISVPLVRMNSSYGDLDLMIQLVSLETWMYIFKFGDVNDTLSQVGGLVVHFTLNCKRSDMFAIDHL